MIKTAVFGCKDGEYVYDQLKKSDDSPYQINYFCDNNASLHGHSIDGIQVISPDALYEKYTDGSIDSVIVAVRNGYNRWAITDQLVNKGIGRQNISWVKPSVLTYSLPMSFNRDEITWPGFLDKPTIPYLELHVHDGCNLKCKGCLHYSNLFGMDEKPDGDVIIRDIQRISEKCEIFQLRLLGGEPLLRKDLAEILLKIRKTLPDTDIAIVTNGTLITKQKKELFDVMKETNVGFNITLYPPTYEKRNEIHKVLDENGVAYGSHKTRADEFSKGFLIKPNNSAEIKSHEICVSKGCLFLRNGRIYKCAPEALSDRFYDHFGIQRNNEEESTAGTDIYDDSVDWEGLIDRLYRLPVYQCRYCSDKLENYKWEISRDPGIEDWVIASSIDGLT